MDYQGFSFVEGVDRENGGVMYRAIVSPTIRVALFKRPIGWSVMISVMFGRVLVRPQSEAINLDAAWSEAIAQLHIVSPLAAALWDEALANAQGAE